MAGLDFARMQAAVGGFQKKMWMGAVPIKRFPVPICTLVARRRHLAWLVISRNVGGLLTRTPPLAHAGKTYSKFFYAGTSAAAVFG